MSLADPCGSLICAADVYIYIDVAMILLCVYDVFLLGDPQPMGRLVDISSSVGSNDLGDLPIFIDPSGTLEQKLGSMNILYSQKQAEAFSHLKQTSLIHPFGYL